MSKLGAVRTGLRDALAEAAPSRIVTRDFQPFAQRDEADLRAGVFAFLGRGQEQVEEYSDHLKIALVGQCLVAESDAPSAVEELEDTLSEEMRSFARGVYGTYVGIQAWQQSGQLEHPYGWIAAELDVGPIDLTLPEGELETLITYRS
ncbi:MAG: hypothetical protein ACLFRB_06800 [Thiohalorhabdus sp.]|uniref:hypothetical protein n=1 Tax=Thiohalorhabdus sp. TaxID=3094134 RepID=UPI00397ED822